MRTGTVTVKRVTCHDMTMTHVNGNDSYGKSASKTLTISASRQQGSLLIVVLIKSIVGEKGDDIFS